MSALTQQRRQWDIGLQEISGRDHQDLVVVLAGVPAAIPVACRAPQRAIRCAHDRPQPAVVTHEMRHRHAHWPWPVGIISSCSIPGMRGVVAVQAGAVPLPSG